MHVSQITAIVVTRNNTIFTQSVSRFSKVFNTHTVYVLWNQDRKIISHSKSENCFSFPPIKRFSEGSSPGKPVYVNAEMQTTVSETLILNGNQTTRLLSLLFVTTIPWWKGSGCITIFKKKNNCGKTAKFSRQTFECLFFKEGNCLV